MVCPRRVVEAIEEKRWTLLPHPPYSPDAAATDFHVNRSVANWMQDEMFNDFDELVASVKGWIASKTRQFFTRGIDMLPEKWEAIVEAGGEYIPD